MTSNHNKLLSTILAAAMFAAAAFSVSACKEEVQPSETSSAVTETSAQLTPTPTPTPRVDHAGHGKIREYSALKDMCNGVTSVLRRPDGKLAVTTSSEFVDGTFVEAERRVAIHIIDPAEDKIVKSVETDDGDDVLLGVSDDNKLVVHNEITQFTKIFSADLELVKVLDNTGMNCYYDFELDRIVYVAGGALCSADLEGNVEVIKDKVFTARLCSYDPLTKDAVVATSWGREDNQDDRFHVVSGDGSVADLYEAGEYVEAMFCGDRILSQSGVANFGTLAVRSLDPTIGEKAYVLANDARVCSSAYSGKCLIVSEAGTENDQVYKSVIVADPARGLYADTGIKLTDQFYPTIFYDENTDHFYVADSVNEDGTKARLIEICPEAFAPDKEMEECGLPEYVNMGAGYTAGTHLADLRRRADQIAARFGVKILLGNEVKNYSLSDTYTVVSIEDSEKEDSVQVDLTSYALDVLEEALSKYDVTFFEMFRDFAGNGGIWFELCDRLDNPSGSFTAGAETNAKGQIIHIVCDANTIGATTIHHELWHAVEQLIMVKDPNAFNINDWNKLNPSKFYYGYDFETYDQSSYEDMCKDNYTVTDKNKVWFAREYSTVNDREDRATLAEMFVGDDYPYDSYKYKSALEEIRSYPHLKEKVEFMERECKRVLGECYWAA